MKAWKHGLGGRGKGVRGREGKVPVEAPASSQKMASLINSQLYYTSKGASGP